VPPSCIALQAAEDVPYGLCQAWDALEQLRSGGIVYKILHPYRSWLRHPATGAASFALDTA
jgi:hypothetical protein